MPLQDDHRRAGLGGDPFQRKRPDPVFSTTLAADGLAGALVAIARLAVSEARPRAYMSRVISSSRTCLYSRLAMWLRILDDAEWVVSRDGAVVMRQSRAILACSASTGSARVRA